MALLSIATCRIFRNWLFWDTAVDLETLPDSLCIFNWGKYTDFLSLRIGRTVKELCHRSYGEWQTFRMRQLHQIWQHTHTYMNLQCLLSVVCDRVVILTRLLFCTKKVIFQVADKLTNISHCEDFNLSLVLFLVG